MKRKLFEYAVLYHPKATKAEKDEGAEPCSKLAIPPDVLLAANEQEAVMQVARLLPDHLMEKLEQTEIIVRPF